MRSTSSTLAVSMMMGVTSLAARRRRQIKGRSPRQHQIQHDQVHRFTRQQTVPVLASSANSTSKPSWLQIATQQISDASVVIDHQNAVGTLRCGRRSHDSVLGVFVTEPDCAQFASVKIVPLTSCYKYCGMATQSSNRTSHTCPAVSGQARWCVEARAHGAFQFARFLEHI